MAFFQAISGLNAASSHLDVIGNNIANSGTFGFKSGSATFADMMAGSGAGLGVKLAGIGQNFNDGIVTGTGKPTDLAISGNGFFRMEHSNGNVFYSRNGQLTKDTAGYLTNVQGLRLSGYPATEINGVMTLQKGAAPTAIKIPAEMMNAKATDKIALSVNLNSSETAIDNSAIPFSTANTDSYNYSTPMTTYDSLGNKRDLQAYFARRPATAASSETKWNVYVVDPASSAAPTASELYFNQQGRLVSGKPSSMDFTLEGNNGSATNQININFANTVQQRVNASNVNSCTPNGYLAGQFNSFAIEPDGSIVAKYSNSEKQILGQVVLANFANPNGLESKGENVWSETGVSGGPLIGSAGTGSLGSLTSSALEASNVDMGKELVTMIVAQRNYQSNAQTIKTQDQMLQTLVSLR